MSKKVPGFYLIVDGKKFGPYLEKHREEMGKLGHLKGVDLTPCMIAKEDAFPPPETKKSEVAKSLPARHLGGLDAGTEGRANLI